MALYQLEHPKKLSKEDFYNLRGTALFEQMFRNRSIVTLTGSLDEASHGTKNIMDWLQGFCKSFYFVDTEGPWNVVTVYIEGDPEVVLFKLTFDGEDYELPDEIKEEQARKQKAASTQQQAQAILDAIKARREAQERKEREDEERAREFVEDIFGKKMPNSVADDWHAEIIKRRKTKSRHGKYSGSKLSSV